MIGEQTFIEQAKDKFAIYSSLATAKTSKGMDARSKHYLLYQLEKYAAHCGDMMPDKFNFLSFLQSLAVSQSTKYLLAHRLGRFLYWGGYINNEDYGFIKHSFKQIRKNWSQQTLTHQDVVNILSYISTNGRSQYTALRDTLIVYVLSTIGLRIGQLLEMKINDLRVTDHVFEFVINRKKDIEGARLSREIKNIPISHTIGKFSIAKLYNDYMTLRQNKTGINVFVNHSGGQLSSDYMRKRLRAVAKALDIEHLSPHTFRHFVGTTVANTFGITKAAILLGHTDIHTTQQYIYPDLVDTSNSLPVWDAKEGG